MTSRTERIKNLQKFKPIEIFIDYVGIPKPDNMYSLVFHPATNTFTIHKIGHTNPMPLMSCSYTTFTQRFHELNASQNRWPENVLARMNEKWVRMSSLQKKKFIDNMPLNSMVLGQV